MTATEARNLLMVIAGAALAVGLILSLFLRNEVVGASCVAGLTGLLPGVKGD